MASRLIALTLAVALAIGGWLLQTGRWQIPYRYAPWQPLDLREPLDLFTSWRLSRAQTDGDACRAALQTSALRWQPVPDRRTGEGCGFQDAVRVWGVEGPQGATLASPVVLSCRAALPLALWERESLQPAAQRGLGSGVARIEHLGSYACRGVNNGEGSTRGTSGRMSRHATADALDVSGFRLRDGRRIELRRDWRGGAAEAAFLRSAHEGACRWFDGVLGPDYNAVHVDHLHLEVGGFGLCR